MCATNPASLLGNPPNQLVLCSRLTGMKLILNLSSATGDEISLADGSCSSLSQDGVLQLPMVLLCFHPCSVHNYQTLSRVQGTEKCSVGPCKATVCNAWAFSLEPGSAGCVHRNEQLPARPRKQPKLSSKRDLAFKTSCCLYCPDSPPSVLFKPTVLLSHFHALVGLSASPFQLSHKNWPGLVPELLVGVQTGGCRARWRGNVGIEFAQFDLQAGGRAVLRLWCNFGPYSI